MYMRKVTLRRGDKETVRGLVREVNELREDMKEIKKLLGKMVETKENIEDLLLDTACKAYEEKEKEIGEEAVMLGGVVYVIMIHLMTVLRIVLVFGVVRP